MLRIVSFNMDYYWSFHPSPDSTEVILGESYVIMFKKFYLFIYFFLFISFRGDIATPFGLFQNYKY